jgi:putative DNA primase/helicase
VAARYLHQEFFEFKPAFKLWLVANHKPRASAGDGALWRRVLLVPFTVSLPEEERDPNVKRLLTQDPAVREAILAWAVRGAREWQERGLDELAAYLDDRCTFGPEFEVLSSYLRDDCDAWCKANGVRPPDARTLAAALTDRGCKAAKVGSRRGWRGVKLGGAA